MHSSVPHSAARAALACLAVGLLGVIFVTGYSVGYLQGSEDVLKQNNWSTSVLLSPDDITSGAIYTAVTTIFGP